MPNVFTAGSFSSIRLFVLNFSPNASTSGLSISCISGIVCAPLLFLAPPGTEVFEILLLNVFAAFCAAEKTDEKNPDWPWPGATAPFSGDGVNGAD